MKPIITNSRIAMVAGIGSFPREIKMDDMMKKFSLKEAIKIAYVPIILTKAAFQFADFIRRQCIENRLPYQKESRIIKQSLQDYERETLGQVNTEVMETLEKQVDYFFEEASSNVQTLWYVVNSELKKKYPELSSYDLLTNIYVCISILDYVRKFESSADYIIRQRTSIPYASVQNKQSIDVRNACLTIADRYKVQKTNMINLAMRTIAIKIDKIVLEVTE